MLSMRSQAEEAGILLDSPFQALAISTEICCLTLWSELQDTIKYLIVQGEYLFFLGPTGP
ncbi:MAG: hypothetical protein DWQ01_16675 [Planctomycetota bacterium]|nr:MAG: hypothetical protein DWQ01_16675 [Planctomycetota bacterium]